MNNHWIRGNGFKLPDSILFGPAMKPFFRQEIQSSHRPTLAITDAIPLCFALMLALLLIGSSGCRINNIESARRAARIASLGQQSLVEVKRQNRLAAPGPIRQWLASRPEPSYRTKLFLKNYNLADSYQANPPAVVKALHEDCRCEPNMQNVHAIAELSQLEADWNLQRKDPNQAAKFYAAAVVHAYQFLFDSKLNIQRNAYDPQFREICDIYNRSLESLFRLVCDGENFRPGTRHVIGDEDFAIEFDIVVEGRWANEEFVKFELVSDFEVAGLDNYHTYGLGVPLIAVRKPVAASEQTPFEKYYPPSLALPLTAFCEVVEFDELKPGGNLRAVMRLYDPLERTVVKTETRNAPLESDLTVPLAYFLNDPLLNTEVLSTVALLDADVAKNYYGFYMLEPFDANKIPVVMVHGLWSNPATWMKMFNDLRANEWIRNHYQFWFYMYPTGQPFWFSARDLRQDLAQLRQDVDPNGLSQTMKEMVFVGHSMGGLLSRMQTIDSGDEFWKIASEHPIEDVKGDPQTIENVKSLFYFDADPTIRRVVTIASPHRGSRYANTATRWLSHQLVKLPTRLTSDFTEFCRENQGLLRNTRHMRIPTSVDSLAPESPFIQKLAERKAIGGVQFHNIVGNYQPPALLAKISHQEGDGVVSLASSHLPDAVSEIEVPSEHVKVHQHPEAILEVKRILIKNLVMTRRLETDNFEMVRQVSHEQYMQGNKIEDTLEIKSK